MLILEVHLEVASGVIQVMIASLSESDSEFKFDSESDPGESESGKVFSP